MQVTAIIMLMIVAILLVLGLCFGSFVNALTWRLKTKRNWVSERSVCVHCGHTLAVQDLIPVVSWLWLRGRCRYCHKPISWQYPLVEALTAFLFIFSYAYWPYAWGAKSVTLFVIWLIVLVGFMALVIYDIRWMTLPNKIVFPLLGIVIVQVLLVVFVFDGGTRALSEALWGFLVIGGLFYLLFQVSGGKWIGGGDVKLGAVLGLLVGGPTASLLLLFLASLLGTLASLPLLATGKLAKTKKRIPFGPFLITAAIIVYLFGSSLINRYKQLLGLP